MHAPDSSVHQTSVPFSDSDEDEFVFTVEGTTTTSPKKQPIAKIAIAGVPVRILVDSGALVNMLDPAAYEAILTKKQIPPGTNEDPHTCLWRSETAAFAREISSGSGVGEQSHSYHILHYRSTNGFFIEL